MKKIIAIFGGMPFYYNSILNKINNLEDYELIVVSPPVHNCKTIGAGVHLTLEGTNFKHVALNEINKGYDYYFNGLNKLIETERPSIVMLIRPYLSYLYKNKKFNALKRTIGFKLLLKDHPFEVLKYEEDKKRISKIDGSESLLFQKYSKYRIPFLKKLLLILLKNKRFKQLEERTKCFNFANAIICYVDDAYNIFGSYGVSKEKIFISRNSTDTNKSEEVRLTLNGKSKYSYNPYRLIHISRLIEWKRVDLIIEALDILKTRYPQIELLVVGEGPKEHAWKELAHSLGLSDKVIFHGPSYSTEALGALCNSSSVYVLAGMGGLSINDAMSFGLPVICSVCDGTEKFLVRENENGIYFEEGNSYNLAEKIQLFFELDEETKEEMKQKSLSIIKNEVNIETVVAKYKETFDYLTGNL